MLGPWLVTADELADPGNPRLSIRVNGEVRQDANTNDLVLGVRDLIEMVSIFYAPHPDDVIMTSTPQGVSPIRPGDTMLARIERIGAMQVSVGAS